MKSQNKIIEFYPSGKVEILDDTEGSFSERVILMKETGYLIRTIYLNSLTDSVGKNIFKESITWDPNKTSLHKIAKLEISGSHRKICSKLIDYLRNSKIDSIISMDENIIMILKMNSFDYEWEISELKRSEVKNIQWMNFASRGWFIDRKKSSSKNPHTYTKYTIFWDPKESSIEEIIIYYKNLVDSSDILPSERDHFRNVIKKINRDRKVSQII